ncbi:hypothetical protein EDC01DRAFT_661403 [Geopyxis carbonaria]|nr:hypothetical protein EDC01DRAFT_661403 [Geopyxis carbonaria]
MKSTNVSIPVFSLVLAILYGCSSRVVRRWLLLVARMQRLIGLRLGPNTDGSERRLFYSWKFSNCNRACRRIRRGNLASSATPHNGDRSGTISHEPIHSQWKHICRETKDYQKGAFK